MLLRYFDAVGAIQMLLHSSADESARLDMADIRQMVLLGYDVDLRQLDNFALGLVQYGSLAWNLDIV